ncbi:cytochrome P450 [Edaphobacter sp. HDX4]|uniref:cytochrome P450 n=1 Tax=Edaphobacter sp. HDX4 TaxID=2794064 RepID=UPI003ACE1CEC
MKHSKDRKWRLPPGLPHPLHFYAFKPWVKLGEPIRLFEYLHRTYGPIAHYRFMGTPIIFLNDPEYIREVLVTQASSFVKERTVRRMKILLGEGLITSDDPIHIRQRRIVAPAFHRQRITAYAEEIVASASHHADTWKDQQSIDISAAMMALSLEIVARTLFNTEVTDDIRRINDEVNSIMDLYHFLIAFPRMESVLHLPIPGVMKFRRSKARLDKVVNRLIAEHKRHGVDRGDLLSMLISSRDEQADASGQHTGMSDEQIRDEVLTIFLAGYETTANALAWTWYLLSQNPEAEARLHAELDQVLGTSHDMPSQVSSRPERSEVEGSASLPPSVSHRLPTLADYPALRYTEQVFAESMRLYPPAWAMGRLSTRSVTLGPYCIPPGAHFFMSQYIISRTPEIYPDPLRFDPDRFTPEAKAARPRFAYFPFGAGSRQCIGESFAWMEGVLAIATIASRWRMTYLDSAPPVPQAKITLRPRNPLMMRLSARERN